MRRWAVLGGWHGPCLVVREEERAMSSVFGDRQVVGELLFFASGVRPSPVVMGLGAGGVEVGFPTAFLTGGELRHVPAHRMDLGRGSGGDLEGRVVVVADDGTCSALQLVRACWSAAKEKPRRLVLLAPWIPMGLEQSLPTAIDLVTLRRDVLPASLPLYDAAGAPHSERVAWCLRAVEGFRMGPAVQQTLAELCDVAGPRPARA